MNDTDNQMKAAAAGRTAELRRQTAETDVRVKLAIDGSGQASISSGIPFLDHMFELFARHGLFDLEIETRGDLEVDDHHTAEDIAIVLGEAFAAALGDKRGIARFGSAYVSMDDALCRAVVDLSGRFYLVYEVATWRTAIGNFSSEMAEHFWRSFAISARMNLHLDLLRGRNTHHIFESCFKAVARAMRSACEADARVQGIPSTKGVL